MLLSPHHPARPSDEGVRDHIQEIIDRHSDLIVDAREDLAKILAILHHPKRQSVVQVALFVQDLIDGECLVGVEDSWPEQCADCSDQGQFAQVEETLWGEPDLRDAFFYYLTTLADAIDGSPDSVFAQYVAGQFLLSPTVPTSAREMEVIVPDMMWQHERPASSALMLDYIVTSSTADVQPRTLLKRALANYEDSLRSPKTPTGRPQGTGSFTTARQFRRKLRRAIRTLHEDRLKITQTAVAIEMSICERQLRYLLKQFGIEWSTVRRDPELI